MMIAEITLERVFSFKYRGLLFKPNLSWSSRHIRNISMKVLGLIYRHFCLHCSSSTLLTLSLLWFTQYLNTVPSFGIHLLRLLYISALESVQCFGPQKLSLFTIIRAIPQSSSRGGSRKFERGVHNCGETVRARSARKFCTLIFIFYEIRHSDNKYAFANSSPLTITTVQSSSTCQSHPKYCYHTHRNHTQCILL